MEPQLPQVNLQPEEQPSPPVMPEQSADIPNSGPEALIETPEVAKNTEKTSNDSLGQIVPPTTSDTPTDDTAQPQNQDMDDVNPSGAVDGDVIEKEWIDKAKSIVSKTAGDPYQQQSQISKLMVDYVLKRYGRIVGESNG